MSTFEVRAETATARTSHPQLVWPARRLSTSGALYSDLTPWLAEWGTPSKAATDLVRIATGAYLADQLTRRPPTFSRSLTIVIQVTDASRWTGMLLDDLADLLSSLTGDRWRLGILQEDVEFPERARAQGRAERVALLSGGLDSAAGAVLSSKRDGVVYVGQWDNPAVKGAQNRVRDMLWDAEVPIDYAQVHHGLNGDKVEGSTRSRSLLFMALGVALATARRARIVEVPENGFTSLNPPLGPERGGALSTRSTHPMTIHRLNQLLVGLRLRVSVENPYAGLTKGELVEGAAAVLPSLPDLAAATLSCAKLDGRLYKGGNPNHNCGLCFACIVRRASLLAAGVTDSTAYLADTLTGAAGASLRERRARDVDGVRQLLFDGVDDVALMASGPYPDDFDFDAALDLCQRALGELARVGL